MEPGADRRSAAESRSSSSEQSSVSCASAGAATGHGTPLSSAEATRFTIELASSRRPVSMSTAACATAYADISGAISIACRNSPPIS